MYLNNQGTKRICKNKYRGSQRNAEKESHGIGNALGVTKLFPEVSLKETVCNAENQGHGHCL